MFFYVTKIFWFFIEPLSLALFLLAAGWLLAILGRRRLGGAASSFAVLILVLAAWTSIGALMLNPLEERFQRPASLPEKIDGIVVLGGGLEGAINWCHARAEQRRRPLSRRLCSATLARRQLLIPAASARFSEGEGDAATAIRFFAALGIPQARLILEMTAQHAENAAFSLKLAAPKPGENWLLVTSAFHMPRSVGLFRKVGFAVIPWPVDYRTSGTEGVGLFRDNPADSLQNTTTALREWIGLVGYWLSGRIDTVFPGP